MLLVYYYLNTPKYNVWYYRKIHHRTIIVVISNAINLKGLYSTKIEENIFKKLALFTE